MKKFFSEYVVRNFGLKLISLLLATGLWLALVHDPVAEVAVEAPIVFRNVPERLGMNYERIPKAQIVLRGPERVVHKLQPSDVSAEIDLAGVRSGEQTFPASVVRVHKPHELEVIGVGPDKFHITFIVLNSGTETHK